MLLILFVILCVIVYESAQMTAQQTLGLTVFVLGSLLVIIAAAAKRDSNKPPEVRRRNGIRSALVFFAVFLLLTKCIHTVTCLNPNLNASC